MNRVTRKLLDFLLITFAITYLCWIALAFLIRADVISLSHPVGVCLHMLGGFGPTIAAILLLDERKSFRTVWKFVFDRKENTAKYFWSFAFLEILIIGLSSLELNPELPLYLIPLVFIQAVCIYGGNEELGWRGIMQPLMEEKLPFPAATLITGSVWGLWHIPLWFVEGTSQQNMPFVLFFLLGILLSFFLAAVYKKTGSVFCCCVLHGLTNSLLSLFVIKITAFLVAGLAFLLIWSIFLWYSENTKGKF